jgi:hypothetical protein
MRRVVVYRSQRVAEMYLFVDATERLERVPRALLARFGRANEVMTLELETGRVLARTTGAEVLAAIDRQGYHLQLPPAPEALAV